MKTVIGVAIALALALSVVPAIAEEDTFQAFSNMPAGEQGLLTPLSDGQLAVIEGEGFCWDCTNVARIRQTNVAIKSFKTYQSNTALVVQSNN